MKPKTAKILRWVGLTILSFAFFVFFGGVWFAILLMFMIGLHEYGHLLAAKYVGIKTAGFYFMPLGGVAFIKENPVEQWKKFIIAFGGPFVGILLCAIALLVMLVGKFNYLGLSDEISLQVVNISFQAIVMWSIINFFNLLPIYPLDGGRLLAALCKNKNDSKFFDKFLLILSCVTLGLMLILTRSPIILVFMLISAYYEIKFWRLEKEGYVVKGGLRIGRLEYDYRVHPPLSTEEKIEGWFSYILLLVSFIFCLFLGAYLKVL